MQKKLNIRVSPQTAADESLLRDQLRQELSLDKSPAMNFRIERRSIDARQKKIMINLTVLVAIDENLPEDEISFDYKDVSRAGHTCHIIGAGPAGLFAALRCLELGIKPQVIERGKDVKSRRRDLAAINKEHFVNPESNYCFGEGGAGTYSDGKLYTRSDKRGDIVKVLKTLVYHGASKEILVDAHPHIGTNKLPALISNIRETILSRGGEIMFGTRLTDLVTRGDKAIAIRLHSGTNETEVPVSHLVLATGHSARDIYELLHRKKITIEAKPFAMGVRVEHPQEIIDGIQYHARADELSEIRRYLPAASYSLVHQAGGRGVYSFCMCPGGIIAPCATAQEEVVTNGWSPSKRNNPYANSGIVTEFGPADFRKHENSGALSGLRLQQEFERNAWLHGGKRQSAPAQRLLDFVEGRISGNLPQCSYKPGIVSSDMKLVLGEKICDLLKEGFRVFGRKMRGYLSNEAVVVGVESRTSTPVRIPRDREKLHHPAITNLFPCGEGAGYAGGIMSAAMDGERCANALRF